MALVDFGDPSNNEYLVVNQYTVIEKNQNKRPDVVLSVNGIPLVVIDLKNAAKENATVRKACLSADRRMSRSKLTKLQSPQSLYL